MNVASLVEDNIARLGEVPTIIFEEREYSNVLLRDNSNRLGNALRSMGIKEGEVVAISMSNCPQAFESFGAIFRIGAVALPILFLLTQEECSYMMRDAGAVAVITDNLLRDKLTTAAREAGCVRDIIVIGGDQGEGTHSYESLLQVNSPYLEIVEREPDDIALIMYTAGTTGKPKGVLLTHNNLITSAQSAYRASETDYPRREIMCLPLAHIYGVASMNTGYLDEYPERRVVVMRWFDPEECMRLIERYRINFFAAVPTMLAMIINHPNVDKYDLSSLEICYSGAGPLPQELRRAFMEKFNCDIRSIYGLTESSGMGAVSRPSQPYKPGAVGKAYDNQEICILDEEDRPLPPGEIGEVAIRGPQVMKGYHRLEEETARVLRGGWLHTGDIGYLDEEGYLFITDRKKDMIKKGGENIMPTQIEEFIYRHPAVAEAAVIGVPDPLYGEEIVAYVALKPGMRVSAQELMEYCGKVIPSFKRPRDVYIVDALPKSTVGKILKRELRRLYSEG